MKITEKEFNVLTGEETIIEREETAEETQTRIDLQNARAAAQQESENAANKKAAVLAKLGLTADEVAALLG